jgi:hypothetical protein
MTISYREVDEMLPNGILDANEVVVTPTYAPTVQVN